MSLLNGIFIFDPLKKQKKQIQKQIQRKVRDTVDKYISPESEAGRVIHKARKKFDQYEEKQENREKAPQNLICIGEKKTQYNDADHLFIRCGIYTHHAIYIGGNQVIHYSSIPDGKLHLQMATLEEFAEGKEIYCMSKQDSPLKYTRDQAVQRAFTRLGEDKYDLLGNNCEAFVRWCRNGGDEYVWKPD